jgi:hypothetical protein
MQERAMEEEARLERSRILDDFLDDLLLPDGREGFFAFLRGESAGTTIPEGEPA